jgi:hypothetical protein
VVSTEVDEPYAVVGPYETWLVEGSSVVHVTVAAVVVGVPAETAEITGGVVSGAGVVTGAAVESGDTFPAASTARTVYEYVVPADVVVSE